MRPMRLPQVTDQPVSWLNPPKPGAKSSLRLTSTSKLTEFVETVLYLNL